MIGYRYIFRKDITSSLKEQFKQITYAQYCSDHAANEWRYPPCFVWDEFNQDDFDGEYAVRIFSRKYYSLYIHLPFCTQKCLFCRHYSMISRDEGDILQYEEAVLKELQIYSRYLKDSKIINLSFGGGTPVLFDLGKIIRKIKNTFKTSAEISINVEATLSSLSKEKLSELSGLGVTRLVIGIQSFDDGVLKNIGREPQDARFFERIVENAKKAGIKYVNAELMAGLPSQSVASFLKDLNAVRNSSVDSMHIYPLIITPRTGLWDKNRNKDKLGPTYKAAVMAFLGKRFMGKGYIDTGDDLGLSENTRNPIYLIPKNAKDYGGIIGAGVSSVGKLFMDNSVFNYTNTLDINRYLTDITSSRLPIMRKYLLDEEESLRSFLIRAANRSGKLDIDEMNEVLAAELNIKAIKYVLKEEMEQLEKIKGINYEHKNNLIRFAGYDWRIYSKLLYSREVLDKCCHKMKDMGISRSQ